MTDRSSVDAGADCKSRVTIPVAARQHGGALSVPPLVKGGQGGVGQHASGRANGIARGFAAPSPRPSPRRGEGDDVSQAPSSWRKSGLFSASLRRGEGDDVSQAPRSWRKSGLFSASLRRCDGNDVSQAPSSRKRPCLIFPSPRRGEGARRAGEGAAQAERRASLSDVARPRLSVNEHGSRAGYSCGMPASKLAGPIVAFRSAKANPFAERKATMGCHPRNASSEPRPLTCRQALLTESLVRKLGTSHWHRDQDGTLAMSDVLFN
jgi:hypothetical protein